MPSLNVEIKAHCRNPKQVATTLRSLNADFIGEDHQIDTYFKTPNGRLKLREGNIENALIHYQRPDQAGPKDAQVTLHHFEKEAGLKAVLKQALGVLVVVDKKRQIYFIENVKFHIDHLNGLGDFVEIEAIDRTGEIGKEKLLAQCNHYLAVLSIEPEDLIEHSYSDMIIKAQNDA